MARKRMLDPAFWDDEDLIGASSDERILFIGLFSLADDYGHITAHPAILHKGIFAYDPTVSIQRVAELRDKLLSICRNLTVYGVDGQQYIWLRKWEGHQDLRFRAKAQYPCHACGQRHQAEDFKQSGCASKPVLTAFLRISTQDIAHILPADYVTSCHVEDKSCRDMETCAPSVTAPNGAESKQRCRKREGVKPDGFDEFWDAYPKKKAKSEAETAYSRQLKGGTGSDILITGARNYTLECELRGTEAEYICYPATFLNKRRFQDYQQPPNPVDFRPKSPRLPPRNERPTELGKEYEIYKAPSRSAPTT